VFPFFGFSVVQLSLVKSRTRQGDRKADPGGDAPLDEPNGEGSVSMPYPVTLVRDETGDAEWLASVDALSGCTARGATPNEALERASAAMDEWLESAKREGKEVPEPKTSQSHSGRLLLRMPQTLHAELSRTAERENVSLNQFITDALAGALGWRAPARKAQVTRTVPGLDGDEAATDGSAGEPIGVQKRPHLSSRVFVANGVIVGLAALVAIVVLIAAVMR
jgi:predicted RNase H-like HicB family nuclease